MYIRLQDIVNLTVSNKDAHGFKKISMLNLPRSPWPIRIFPYFLGVGL